LYLVDGALPVALVSQNYLRPELKNYLNHEHLHMAVNSHWCSHHKLKILFVVAAESVAEFLPGPLLVDDVKFFVEVAGVSLPADAAAVGVCEGMVEG
jgi:hypothetical protein